MRSARLQLHGSANELLGPDRAEHPLTLEFELPTGLRDLVQSTGIPMVELRALSLNGSPASASSRVDDGDVIEAWSRFPLETPLDHPAFLLDVHLGRLAHYLRLFGFDAAYQRNAEDRDLVDRATSESRVLLTRDRGLLMWARLRAGSFVRSTDPRRQIVEVMDRFALYSTAKPLTRCLACNGSLQLLAREEAAGRVPPSVAQTHEDFRTCPDCRRVYWKGTHYHRLLDIIEHTTAGARS